MFKSKKKLFFSVILVISLFIIAFNSLPLKPIIINSKIIIVEVADSSSKRAQGLKGRSSLAKNSGMLFCFEQEGYPHFWMKDTLIALDIAFIDINRQIIEIQQMSPKDEGPRYVPKNKAKYAIEMNLGWFESNGINPGDRVFFW